MRRTRAVWIGVATIGAVVVCGTAALMVIQPTGSHAAAAGNARFRVPGDGNGSPASAFPRASTSGSAGPSASATPGPTEGATAPTAFAHPGVLVSRAQLDFIRAKALAGAQPWAPAYNAMKSSAYGSLTRQPAPRSDVDCGSGSVPDLGCSDERQDALAAYTDALVWYISRDSRYAAEAINLMDAWSTTLKTHTNSNAPLQTGWAGTDWARAAELIKSTYPPGWPNEARFATLLRTVYLPVLVNGSGANGNWELIMTDALMGIAVFLDDKASFNRALALWRGRVPAYIYLKSDGPTQLSPPQHAKAGAALTSYWYGQTTLVDGLAQETCRDFGHAAMGINAAFHSAETARTQGVDLWGEQKTRFTAAMELHAQYEMGTPVPSWLCGGHVTLGTGGYWEAGYNALHNRLGMNLPQTAALLASRRPTGTDNHSSAWETLTYFSNPN